MSAFYNVDQPPFNSRSSARAIAAANNGLLFDPSDMTTLYQDAAGTTPVTAVEQPVGKILDKSGNGNHATQSITASRPVLSARYNLLTKTEYFSDEKWVKTNCTIISNVAQAPNGTISADKMVIRSGTLGQAQASNIATVGGSIPVIAKVTMKAGEKSIGYIQCNSAGGSLVSTCVMFNLSTGTKGSLITLAGAGLINPIAGITPLSNGFYECSLSFTTNATAGSVYVLPGFCDSMSSRSVVGDGVGGAYIFSADLRIGTDSGPYQRVNTATDYDTDPRYFPKYLSFDGVDDYLNLPYMGLYAGGGMSIIAARNAVSQSTDTYIISERSTTDADPKYFPSRQLASGGNMDAYISDDAAAVVLDTVGSAFGGAADKVIRSVVDTGSNLKLYKNGAIAADDNYTRAGTLTLNNTTLGASVSTTSGNYASMKLYGLIVTKSALTDAQRIKCERYAASKAGVIL